MGSLAKKKQCFPFNESRCNFFFAQNCSRLKLRAARLFDRGGLRHAAAADQVSERTAQLDEMGPHSPAELGRDAGFGRNAPQQRSFLTLTTVYLRNSSLNHTLVVIHTHYGGCWAKCQQKGPKLAACQCTLEDKQSHVSGILLCPYIHADCAFVVFKPAFI